MDSDHKKVEAVMFAIGKEVSTERLASLCSLTDQKIEKIVKSLQQQYSENPNSLQIVKKETGWKLTVEDQYVPLVSSIVSSTELERPLMETLAVIAWKYPIVQSEIVKLRNASAYDHMNQLVEQGFISKERFGRTYKVKLTKKFFNYFDLPSDAAKKAFLQEVPSDVLQEAEAVDKEADEVDRLLELEEQKDAGHDELKNAMAQVK